MFILYNSLSKKKEQFIPIDKKNVRMYVCGPTVYDTPHLGNARSVVVYDILFRMLSHFYGAKNVTYVRNITDVDDKINEAAKKRSIPISTLTQEVTKIFHHNMHALGCLEPNFEPKATLHINEMIKIISILLDKKHAYLANNHVYFAIDSFADYLTFTSRVIDKMISGARVTVDSFKRNAADFVLWKPQDPIDDPSSVFDSPWGKGRPGWHIECSAMSYKYLGENFDIHGGGVDLIFPHHSNEIAQTKCAFDNCHFAKFWVHNGFVTVNKEKMSKSLGNYITVSDLLNKKISGEVIRYILLSTHYRKPLNFNDLVLTTGQKNMGHFYRALAKADNILEVAPDLKFIEALSNDLNVPAALAILHEYSNEIHKSKNIEEINHLASLLKSGGNIIGLFACNPQDWFGNEKIDEEIEFLIAERILAKKEKNWQKTDEIRDYLRTKNIVLEDTKDGTKWRKI